MLPAQPASGLIEAQSILAPPRPGDPLGIVAGGGVLPQILADRAAGAGWRPVVVTIADGISRRWERYEPTPFRWGRTGDLFPFFARAGVRNVVFAGTISVRPDYRSIIPTLRTLAILPEILRITRGGDDSLLRAVARAFEARGFALHAVHDFVPQLLAPAGLLTARRPSALEEKALERASLAARRLGEIDTGQAAVASQERVIALEGIEGTREMLARVADLARRGRIARSERCVLVKMVKPQQDRRFDLPSVGIETVDQAREAGLAGIGLSAGASLLIEADAVLNAAERGGLFIRGLTEDAS